MDTENNTHNEYFFLPNNQGYFENYLYGVNNNGSDNNCCTIETAIGNATTVAPPGYTDSTVPVVIIYCALFLIGAGGNLSVVVSLIKSKRHRKSRVSLMMFNLAVADLMVAFFMIPLEVGWRITVAWRAGNIACKIFLFIRAFCLYLSSNLLVCISLDRCFGVMYPLRVSAAHRRGKIMLLFAWIIAAIYATPQSFIFHVAQHPQVPDFVQCVSFGYFSSQILEMTYNLFCLIAMYFLPLIIISISYTFILCEIANRSKEKVNVPTTRELRKDALRLRCNDLSHIERARQRTLRLTITIVFVFVWCWTPYVFMTMWYIIDRESALKVDNKIQDSLFLMAVSNSCMNPLVYGTYIVKFNCWPFKKNDKDYVGNGEKTIIQRRSTDNGSGPLNTREKDDHDCSKDKYYLNNTSQLPNLVKEKATETKCTPITRFATNGNINVIEMEMIKNRKSTLSKKTRYPSLYEFPASFLSDEKYRTSFCSEPVHHNYDSEIDSGLTRSIDTEPIYEQYEMDS